MGNEKEVREGSVRYPVCSSTGAKCECGTDSACRRKTDEPFLDRAPEETLRWVRVAALRLEDARSALNQAEAAAGDFRRRYPCPEVRDLDRKVAGLIEDILEWAR